MTQFEPAFDFMMDNAGRAGVPIVIEMAEDNKNTIAEHIAWLREQGYHTRADYLQQIEDERQKGKRT